MIYLDNAATTYPKPETVYKSAENMIRNSFNAGRGVYDPSTNLYKKINEARALIAKYVNSDSDNVVFTSSATEASNMIINGLSINEGDHVYVSPFEHNAIIRPLHAKGANIHIIPFDNSNWDVKIEELNDMFVMNKPKAVFLSQISNVTGFELPYSKIFEISSKYMAINVLDAAQGFGLVDIEKKSIDYIIFAGHKSLYGIFGVGGFIKLGKDILIPTKFGGTGSDSLNFDMPDSIPNRFEAGSSNVISICSLIDSITWINNNRIADHEYKLTEYLISNLQDNNKIKIYLPDKKKTLGIVSISVAGYNPQDVAEILYDEFKICVRSGYHCAPLIHDFINSKSNHGTVRISVGAFNKTEDIDNLISAIKTL